MSGALARVLNTVSAVGNVLTLLTGGSPVTLDDFEFQDYEVPERLSWGGAHSQVTHRYPGGARVVDVMGPDDAPITWSGMFLSGNVEDRAAELNALKDRGDPVLLTWGGFSRTVVVASVTFESAYQHIGYQISVTVLPDDDYGTNGLAPSALDQIKSDVDDALGFDLTGTLADAQSALSTAQQIVTPLAGILGPSAVRAVSGALGGAAGALGVARAVADGGMAAVADAQTIVSSIGDLPAALSWCRVAAVGAVVDGYAQRSSLNLTGSTQPPVNATVLRAASDGSVVTVVRDGQISSYRPA